LRLWEEIRFITAWQCKGSLYRNKTMISNDSILRRLPPALDRKQALYFDGIRHCGEIAGLAYSRLKKTLTKIAVKENESGSNNSLFTSAFLDAWSLVDVIDRFRSLWISLPNSSPLPPTSGSRSFAEISQSIRDLRNVADHIAQRADYVVARKGTALGILSWFTVLKQSPLEGIVCTIIPGTMQVRSTPVVNPAGQLIEIPTSLIQLSAGEYTASLSETLPEMEKRIHELEKGVQRSLDKQVPNAGSAGADVLLKMTMTFGDR
jgi:hypothetical protein